MVKNRIYLIYLIYVSLSSSPLFPYWIFNHTKRVMYAISMFAIGSFPHLEQPSVLVVQTVHRLQSTSLLHLPHSLAHLLTHIVTRIQFHKQTL